MRQLSVYCLILFLATSCSFFEGSEGDDPPCDSLILIDERVINAVPYQDGQMLLFDASDGTSFSAVVSRTRFEGTQISGCMEELQFNFGGINVNNSLGVEISLFASESERLDFRVALEVNGLRSRSHDVTLNEAGQLVATADNRLLPDTVLNGQTYTNVVVQDYSYIREPLLSKSYYNRTAGFIGAETADGHAIFLRE